MAANFDPFEAVQQMQSRIQSQYGGAGLRRAAENARIGNVREKFLSQQQAPGGGSHDDGGGGFGSGRAGAYSPAMLALRDSVLKQWGDLTVGGYANRNVAGTNKKSDHASWRAWDFMVGKDRAKGDAIANYVIQNAAKYGVKNLIWYDRIWDPSRGWRPYGHPGGGRSDTLQHRDHPHVGFN